MSCHLEAGLGIDARMQHQARVVDDGGEGQVVEGLAREEAR